MAERMKTPVARVARHGAGEGSSSEQKQRTEAASTMKLDGGTARRRWRGGDWDQSGGVG